MSNKTIYVCGEEKLLNLLKWILREFNEEVTILQSGSEEKLQLDLDKHFDILFLDSETPTKPVVEFLRDIHRRKPALKTILVVFPANREEVMAIIKENLVRGVVVRPFTAEVVCNYVGKLL